MVYITLVEGLQILMLAFGGAAIHEGFEPVIIIPKLLISALLSVMTLFLVFAIYFKMFLDNSKQK